MEIKYLAQENEIQKIYSDLGLIVPVGDLSTTKAPAIQPLPTSSTQTTVTAQFNVMSGGDITALSYKVNDGEAVSLTPAKGVVTITLDDLEYNSGPYEIEITATNATGSTVTSSTIDLQHYTNWATPDEVLAGNRYIGEDGEEHTGEYECPTCPEPVLETVPITPTTSAQTITPSTGYDGIGTANVAAVTSAIDANIAAGNIKNGVTILGVTGSYAGEASGTIEITSNATGIDVSTYAYADVNVVPNYNMDPADYFCMTAINDNTEIEFSKKNDDAIAPYTLYYSTDNGTTFTEYVDQTIALDQGEKVIWYGDNPNGLSATSVISNFNSFYITDDVQFSGNIMSLISTDIRYNQIVPYKGFAGLFNSCEYITTAPALPATKIGVAAYKNMFQGCESLTAAPALPATTLAQACYQQMFQGCESLTAAPALPATSTERNCYYQMFQNCSALTTVPAELPATSLALNCYTGMFQGCTSITASPEMKFTTATTTTSNALNSMFNGCTSLNTITINTTSWAASIAINWVANVASSGDFYNNGEAIISTGTSGIPANWAVHIPA